MKKLYPFFFLIILSSCQKPTKSVVSNDNASFLDVSFFSKSITIDSTAINNCKNQLVIDFYKKNDYKTVWHSEELRNLVIQVIKNSEYDGLHPLDYWYNSIQKNEATYNSLSSSQLINYDLLLTQSMQSYLSHIGKGKVNPILIYDDYDLKEKNINVNQLLQQCIDDTDFTEVINQIKPIHPVYTNLKETLLFLKNLPKDKTGLIDKKIKKVVIGKEHPAVLTIKKKLNYWNDASIKDSVSTKYDAEIVEGIKKFQQRHGLYPDGLVGIGTIEALNVTRDQRIEQIRANMERWRWYARDFGSHHLLSNIPDYSIIAIKNGDTTQRQRIVVGKVERPTPVLESKISNINLNPNWTVPPTILAEDVFPDAQKSRGAFVKQKLKIYNWKKKEISPWDWKMEDAKKYSYVQLPGRNNALGLMKINFKNKYSVYMHDTNHRDFFKYTYRALSSGCVRLEKPLEMAAYLLNDEKLWTLEKIKDTTNINHYVKLKKVKFNELVKKDAEKLSKNPLLVISPRKFIQPELKTIIINLAEEIHIHQLYWTAWKEKNSLQFREDIYCLDRDLANRLNE